MSFNPTLPSETSPSWPLLVSFLTLLATLLNLYVAHSTRIILSSKIHNTSLPFCPPGPPALRLETPQSSKPPGPAPSRPAGVPPPPPVLPPPPPTFSLRARYGAILCERTCEDQEWVGDVQFFKENNKFLVYLSGKFVAAFEVHENTVRGVYKAWTILRHCFQLSKFQGRSVDWKRMEEELRVPAEEHVLEEYKELLQRVNYSSGYDRLSILKKAEHRKLILYLGKSVQVLEKNSKQQYVLRGSGILEDVLDEYTRGIFVGGKFYRFNLDDLIDREWIVKLVSPEEALIGDNFKDNYIVVEEDEQ